MPLLMKGKRMRMSDNHLLDAIAARSQKAFNDFYEKYASLLYQWAYNRTKNIEVTNEITQIFWENIWLNPAVIKTDETDSAKNFLLRYFTFRILDYFKSNDSKFYSEVYASDYLSDEANQLSYTHILEELEIKDIHRLLDTILSELPEISRQIFEMRWKMGYSVRETAEKLQIDEKSVYNRYSWVLSIVRSRVASLYLKHGEYGAFYLYLIFLCK